MVKNKKAIKKEMKKELVSAVVSQMGGLNPSGQAKMKKFLMPKIGTAISYYLSLQKKKKWSIKPTIILASEVVED